MDILDLPTANVGSWSVMGASRSKICQNGKVRLGSTLYPEQAGSI